MLQQSVIQLLAKCCRLFRGTVKKTCIKSIYTCTVLAESHADRITKNVSFELENYGVIGLPGGEKNVMIR